jgi:hypothetical protein
MLLVEEIEPGVHELLYMWLPTWIGMNADLKKRVERHISKLFVGSEATLVDMHNAVIEYLCGEFPAVLGLREYLKSVEQITIEGDEHGQAQ